MIVPIRVNASFDANCSLPPQLVKLGNHESMLIELQGSLEVESNEPRERDGQRIGRLRFDETSVNQ